MSCRLKVSQHPLTPGTGTGVAPLHILRDVIMSRCRAVPCRRCGPCCSCCAVPSLSLVKRSWVLVPGALFAAILALGWHQAHTSTYCEMSMMFPT